MKKLLIVLAVFVISASAFAVDIQPNERVRLTIVAQDSYGNSWVRDDVTWNYDATGCLAYANGYPNLTLNAVGPVCSAVITAQDPTGASLGSITVNVVHGPAVSNTVTAGTPEPQN